MRKRVGRQAEGESASDEEGGGEEERPWRQADLGPRRREGEKNKKQEQLLTAARVRRRVTPDDASRLTCARVTGRGGGIEEGVVE